MTADEVAADLTDGMTIGNSRRGSRRKPVVPARHRGDPVWGAARRKVASWGRGRGDRAGRGGWRAHQV